MLYKDNKKVIDNNTLASLTILNPKEKDILIVLITKKKDVLSTFYSFTSSFIEFMLSCIMVI